ncbi:MAG: tRNA lysidine(34) synthetase TilS [Chloroflexi bacterium HGW-Chloroflexi-7]|nr:MAG: tRNA lysidine(34) synthetase TilS [Chloroflexi bacterium HGW-Chloroflexi-7]
MNLAHFSDLLIHQCKLDPLKPVVAGVSGGPDSLCMLDLLIKSDLMVYVLHVNHGLRIEAKDESRFVEEFCATRNIPCLIKTTDIKTIAFEKKLTIEEASRVFRYKALFEYAKEINAQAVLVAHNTNDQAETVLMHLLRGSGLSGLKGMQMHSTQPIWSDCIALVRPLLKTSRKEILAYCNENDLIPVNDLSNQDPKYFRNRIRLELLPELMTYNPRILELLASMSDIISVDQSFLEIESAKAWQHCVVKAGNHFILFNRLSLSELHPALLRRVLRKAISEIEPELRDLDYATTERAVSFLDPDNRVKHMHLLSNIEMVKSRRSELLICKQDEILTDLWPQIDVSMNFVPNVKNEISMGNNWKITRDESDQVPVFEKDGKSAVLDADLLYGLSINTHSPGDRFQPYGLNGQTVKLGDYWTSVGLPEKARKKWPLLRNGNGDIVWVIGTQISDRYKITAATKKIMIFRLIQTSSEN